MGQMSGSKEKSRRPYAKLSDLLTPAPASRSSRSDRPTPALGLERVSRSGNDPSIRHIPFYNTASSAPGSYDAVKQLRSGESLNPVLPALRPGRVGPPVPEASRAPKRKQAKEIPRQEGSKRLKGTLEAEVYSGGSHNRDVGGGGCEGAKEASETPSPKASSNNGKTSLAGTQRDTKPTTAPGSSDSSSVRIETPDNTVKRHNNHVRPMLSTFPDIEVIKERKVSNKSRDLSFKQNREAGRSRSSLLNSLFNRTTFDKRIKQSPTATPTKTPSNRDASKGRSKPYPAIKEVIEVKTKSREHVRQGLSQPSIDKPPDSQSSSHPSVSELLACFSKAKRAKISLFFTLPRELRDEIYGYLLTSSTPITVLKAWTQRYNRYRGDLNPTILSTCRQAAAEGTRVLYSTNTFQYILRDDGQPIPEGMNKRGAIPSSSPPHRSCRSSSKHDTGDVIFLAKYASFFRHICLTVEGNRTGETHRIAAADALSTLASAGVRPNFMSFDLSPRLESPAPGSLVYRWTLIDFFSIGLPLVGVLRRDLCYRRLHFAVRHVDGRRLEMSLDADDLMAAERAYHAYQSRQSRRGRRLDGGGDGSDVKAKEKKGAGQGDEPWDPWAEDPVVREARARRVARLGDGFRCLRGKIEQACEAPDAAIMTGLWSEDKARKDGVCRSGNAQSVDTSHWRARELEGALVSGEASTRRRRFFCISRVDGKLNGHIA